MLYEVITVKELPLPPQVVPVPEEQDHRYQPEHGGQGRLPGPEGYGNDLSCHGEFGFAMGIKNSPISPYATFQVPFPGLVKGFHEEVIKMVCFRQLQKFADEKSFVGHGRHGPFQSVAQTGPADFADDDLV